MKKKTSLSRAIMMVCGIAAVVLISQPAFSEMTLNDNVNIGGEVFLEGDNCGVNFTDGSRQTTASSPPWSRKIAGEDRFELVLPIGSFVKVYEAVLDRETGLVWQRDTSETTYDWYGAQSYCYGANIAGRKGWRLPTVAELATLLDPYENNPSLPDGHPFTNVKTSTYWSSTGDASSTAGAWGISFYDGNIYVSSKPAGHYLRAVRSAQ